MYKSRTALILSVCATVLLCSALTGCRNNQGVTEDINNVQSDTGEISGDILHTGGNFNKIVVLSKLGSTVDSSLDTETEVPNPEQNKPTMENPATRPNIGLATMNLDDMVGGLNTSEEVGDKTDRLEITLDGYIKHTVKYDKEFTVNDFGKDIRYFCWSLPESAANTFINALGEICSEQGYLHDGLKVTKNTYHTQDYEYYVYEIQNNDHVISLAINYDNTNDVYYTNRDK